ncbi:MULTISPECIES: hypothetical protein [Pseudomonas]|nr:MULTISPECIES: hypothetical protein [Pseudomonas]BBN65835.1 hypothetical protein KUIN1_50250 [Pseudomonas sp. KUIN-1]
MKVLNKILVVFLVLITGLAIAIAFLVSSILGRVPDVSKKSPSGDYLIESVPASSLLTPRDAVYLRFTDLRNPDKIYRTPLFSDISLDMQADEDQNTVGVIFIEFNKKSKKFTLALPNPREHWLDFFVSNTPYKVLEN